MFRITVRVHEFYFFGVKFDMCLKYLERCLFDFNSMYMAFSIVSSGIYLPKNRWSSSDMDRFLSLPSGTSKNRYGVEYRHVADDSETAIYMGSKAVESCLAQTSHSIADIDLLIYASGTHHQALPYDASALLSSLDAPVWIESFDLNSTCLSFLTALDLAQSLFIAKRYRRILIVTSEVATGVTLNRSFAPEKEIATLFADGAAAFLLKADEQSLGLLARKFETHHSGYEYCQIAGGGSHLNPHKLTHQEYLYACRFVMDGKKLFRHIRKVMTPFLTNGLKESAISLEEVDYFLPHQASFHALKKLPNFTGFSESRIVNNFSTLGNQVAASIPINLHLLRNERDISGKSVLLAGSAAGLSLGMGLISL